MGGLFPLSCMVSFTVISLYYLYWGSIGSPQQAPGHYDMYFTNTEQKSQSVSKSFQSKGWILFYELYYAPMCNLIPPYSSPWKLTNA